MKLVYSFLLFTFLFGCKSEKSNNTIAYASLEENSITQISEFQDSESYKRGKDVYSDFCITCHLSDGKGITGTFPPLDGSNWLTEKRKESIHAVKYGLQGPIEVNGENYNMAMAPLGLTDQEVADVLTYVMNSWSNSSKKPVTLEEVKAIEK
ncbi:c-type cytochrome [Gillisia sp. Q332]|uniref:c-type cytochrome n=1 Tax=Gillisia xinjiangensis TaxID=3384765 RepID=UPI00391D8F92